MEEICFPYHKVIQQKLVRSILIPVAISGFCLLVFTPFLLIFLMTNQTADEARQASEQLTENFQAYRQGMEDIRKEPHIRSFLKEGKDAIEVYQILYSRVTVFRLRPILIWKVGMGKCLRLTNHRSRIIGEIPSCTMKLMNIQGLLEVQRIPE